MKLDKLLKSDIAFLIAGIILVGWLLRSGSCSDPKTYMEVSDEDVIVTSDLSSDKLALRTNEPTYNYMRTLPRGTRARVLEFGHGQYRHFMRVKLVDSGQIWWTTKAGWRSISIP